MSAAAAVDPLHRAVFWICAAVALAVLGLIIYSQLRFRGSQAARNAGAELAWTFVPPLIWISAALPAAVLILKEQYPRDAELTVRIIGRGPTWDYRYLDTAAAGIAFRDQPLVVPSGTKIHLLLSTADGVHSWYVPAFGPARPAIPGLVNGVWFKVDTGEEGIYRGRCAMRCAADDRPVRVDVLTPEGFSQWVRRQRAQRLPAR